ncbi:MAG: SUMF1/EgtB/PvdO family nonheme iron enzyme, partial [Cyanobacteria bacterium J06649_4]
YGNLKRFFRVFQASELSVGDNLWFFFAGHGELCGEHDYLMPIDADPGDVKETALKLSDIAASLRGCGADNTVMLLDACRSEGKRSPVGVGTDEQPGMVTIYSCSARQASYEIDELQHGAFTYALLEGFRLQGANSCATVQRINQYLRHQVPKLSERYRKGPQVPYMVVEPSEKSCLILLPERARLEDVDSLKLAAHRAENKHKWDLAQQFWIRVLGASRIDQDAIEGLQRIALKRGAQPSVADSATVAVAGRREVVAPEVVLHREVLDASISEPSIEPPPTVAPQKVDVSESAEQRVEFEAVKVNAEGKIIQRERRSAIHFREDLGQGVSLDLVQIPGGTFLMGSPEGEGSRDEYPQHEVTVAPFLMGQYLVTQAQWKAVSALPKVKIDLDSDPSDFKGANRPVEQVSWHDAVEFCQRLSKHSGRDYRLPSEAEWEYACRAGTTTPFCFGEKLMPELANSQNKGETTDVGSFPANGFGLYDVHGNVCEWCQDVWHASYQSASNDGRAWLEGGNDSSRVIRGGSWYITPWRCRSAYRNDFNPVVRSYFIGFRVSCAAPRALV